MDITVEVSAESLHVSFTGAAVDTSGTDTPFNGDVVVEIEGMHGMFSTVGEVADLDAWDVPYTAHVEVTSDDGTLSGDADDGFTVQASELATTDDIVRHGFGVEDLIDEACISMLSSADMELDHVVYDAGELLDELASHIIE